MKRAAHGSGGSGFALDCDALEHRPMRWLGGTCQGTGAAADLPELEVKLHLLLRGKGYFLRDILHLS